MERAQSRSLPLAAGVGSVMCGMEMEEKAITLPPILMELSSHTPAHASHTGESGWRGAKPAD